jgi:hypothetical protein
MHDIIFFYRQNCIHCMEAESWLIKWLEDQGKTIDDYYDIDIGVCPLHILDQYRLNWQMTPIIIEGDYIKHQTYQVIYQYEGTDAGGTKIGGCGGCNK